MCVILYTVKKAAIISLFIALKIRNKIDYAVIEDDEPFHIDIVYYLIGV